jgi:hypothetical protein
MSDVDWLALWVEFAQAIDNEQLEIAERIIYLDGRLDFTELSSSKLIAAARQIVRERVAERIIYLDGRWDFTELSSSKLIAAARQIIRERVEGRS